MNRSVFKEFILWKESADRKVLLIRGARQVGKTYLIRQLGKEFPDYLEINLEQNTKVHQVFEQTQDPKQICQLLSAYFGQRIIPGKTLLFLDEVQSCIPAIQSLRYFYEQLPELHVIAAGSLLEFALSEIPAFGVGRIRQIFMYPMSFDEYLEALDFQELNDAKRKASPENPLAGILHARLLEHLRTFLVIGGMPEVVANYLKTKDYLSCQQTQNDLILSLESDFARYKKRSPVLVLREVFRSVVNQAGSKFVFTKAGQNLSVAKVQEAFELLRMAQLVFPIYHTSASGIPLGTGINHKRFKALLMDTGLQLRLSSLELSDFLLSQGEELINRGAIAELFAGLEIIKYRSPYEPPDLYYWHREARNSSAEVDYIMQKGRQVLPIEVKSGSTGKMQSLYLFLKEKQLKQGIRISTENFSRYPPIDVYPLYALENLVRQTGL
jgi:predicted AAA+ superfamily ATPase